MKNKMDASVNSTAPTSSNQPASEPGTTSQTQFRIAKTPQKMANDSDPRYVFVNTPRGRLGRVTGPVFQDANAQETTFAHRRLIPDPAATEASNNHKRCITLPGDRCSGDAKIRPGILAES